MFSYKYNIFCWSIAYECFIERINFFSYTINLLLHVLERIPVLKASYNSMYPKIARKLNHLTQEVYLDTYSIGQFHINARFASPHRRMFECISNNVHFILYMHTATASVVLSAQFLPHEDTPFISLESRLALRRLLPQAGTRCQGRQLRYWLWSSGCLCYWGKTKELLSIIRFLETFPV